MNGRNKLRVIQVIGSNDLSISQQISAKDCIRQAIYIQK
jgi:hypothetical protein